MQISPFSAASLSADCDLTADNFKKLAALPGNKKWHERKMVFRPSGANIEYILKHWPDAVWHSDIQHFAKECLLLKEDAKQLLASKNDNDFSLDDPSGYRYKRAPMDHQRKAFLLSRDKKVFALLMEQGTGKTKVTIDTACYLYKQGLIDFFIVIAWPNGVHRNWVTNELHEDIPSWCKYKAAAWSAKLNKANKAKFDSVINAKNCLRIMTFNVEAFVSKNAQAYILRCLQDNRALLVIDQSASIKTHNAKRTKFIVDKLSKLAEYRRILDGAPAAEGAEELYSQFKFLDPRIIGHDTWTAFRAEFCRIGHFREITGYKNLKELHARVDGHLFRVLADDCLDLPERIYKAWQFSLSKNEQRIYDELNQKSLAFFAPTTIEEGNEEILETNLAMVKTMRLQQIASGWWPEQGNFKAIEDEPTRLQALKSLLAQAPGKAIIFSRFRADLGVLEQLLGKASVSYHGGVSEDDREVAKKRFMTDPTILYFIGQPRNAGIGHTLTAAKHVIFYSNDSSLRFREESERRAYRKGLTHKLIIWDLVAEKTSDAKILQCFRDKKDLSEEILKDPKQFFLIHGSEQ